MFDRSASLKTAHAARLALPMRRKKTSPRPCERGEYERSQKTYLTNLNHSECWVPSARSKVIIWQVPFQFLAVFHAYRYQLSV